MISAFCPFAINPSSSVKPKSHHRLSRELDRSHFCKLWQEADKLWESNLESPSFHAYVSADYEAVLESLVKLENRVHTILEWGSGLGVVTIMASYLGFDAYGIEAESELVEYSREFAAEYGPQARFAQGSFIPDQFVWNPRAGDEAVRTMIDQPDAYDELDMDLSDFDLIYAYPWPTEHELYHNVIREFGCSNALLLSYDAREGIDLVQFNRSE